MDKILSTYSASISELKKNPSALIKKSQGAAIAILNHNSPTAYLVPTETYELLMDKIDDIELAEIVKERQKEKEQAIEVNINDL